jgi:high affinity sulfate transporter 1
MARETRETSGWTEYVPIADWLPDYQRSWLTADAIAAATVWALLVPEAMAYASLAGMPPETGLWAAPLALLGYAIFGTSRQLNVGPSSTVAVLSLSVVAPVAAGDPEAFIALTSWLAILVGVFFVIFGIFKAGFIADFMSKPVLDGFIVGLALTIAAGQLHKLFGLDVDGSNFFEDIWFVIRDLGETNWWTFAVGAGSLAALFLIDRFIPRLPGALVVMFAAIILLSITNLEQRGVHVIGEIPGGLPPFGFPDSVGFSNVVELIPGALAVLIVGFAESVAAARKYASKHGYEVDASQEMIALGASNLGAGFSGGFVVDGSLSKTAAADGAGQKTQMTSIIVAVLVLITALWFTGIFENLPEATLAAIVIHAVWHLIDFGKISRYYNIRKNDFWAGLVALVGVLAFGILSGLGLAVILSLFFLVGRASRPKTEILGEVTLEESGITVYRSIERFPDAGQLPGLLIYRFDAQLFFANAPVFEEHLMEAVRAAEQPVEVVLVDAESISDIDSTALVMLAELEQKLADQGISTWYARVRGEPLEVVQNAETFAHLEEPTIFPTVGSGVEAFESGAR